MISIYMLDNDPGGQPWKEVAGKMKMITLHRILCWFKISRISLLTDIISYFDSVFISFHQLFPRWMNENFGNKDVLINNTQYIRNHR